MKSSIGSAIIGLFLVIGSGIGFAMEAPQAVKDLANSKLAGFGSDAVIVAAVKKQNDMERSLSDIQAMDRKWQDTAGTDAFMESLMSSECGKHLVEILESAEYFAEIFVMDNQGAIVAMTAKTSDYWQGDENKFKNSFAGGAGAIFDNFKNSFAGGAGAIFVDQVEFDDSAQAYLVQISIPVLDDGKAIGAITFGIDFDKVQ